MKRLLIIPALLFGSVALATDYNYEVTPLIGYNIAEGNIDLDNYAVFGAEVQYNGLDSVIKPELSIFYSKADYNTISKDTDVYRFALNGVYEYDKLGFITPLIKAGVGYESMNDGSYTHDTGNADSAFVDAGIGAKIPFTDNIALKLEAVYMLKYNDARYDNNLMILAGLNIAFGAKADKAAPVVQAQVQEKIEEKPEPIVEEKIEEQVVAAVAIVDLDTDKDGVLNEKDICPNTPLNEAVNSDGCPAKVTLNVNFENNSDIVNQESYDIIEKYADFLNKYDSYVAKIIGYTDSRGSEKYNQQLSEKRANSVKGMLLERGVPANRLSSLGMGENNPIADNSTSEGRAQNRRIEAELTKQ
ncbi:OmpA family protein [Sulfurimonas sp.]|uniref:OmpA family protein n=1 Tax=Sulfurimonas sp. TaxID=2022749 RepID=UPI002AB203D9|nr:OmpA family protein [Sulfurimonas sp.]